MIRVVIAHSLCHVESEVVVRKGSGLVQMTTQLPNI